MRQNDFVIINDLKFPAKFAISPEEQEAGLMHCITPTIMAFPSNKSVRSFWMKNTPMALDLIFACDGLIVDRLPGVPFSLEQICCNQESDLIVEFPRGLLNHFPISIGDPIKLEYSIKSIAKKYDLILNKKGKI
jgi:uncharacterized membrane protein (UPF0127 family)